MFLLELRRAEAARLSRRPILREEVSANAIDQHSERRLAGRVPVVVRCGGAERADVRRQHRELWVSERPLTQQRLEPVRCRAESVGKPA